MLYKQKSDQKTMDINDKIIKFNAAFYSVLLNSNDLSDIIMCELVVK